MQTALPGNKQFFISLTQTATSQADRSAHVVIRGRMLCQATCQDPPPNHFSVMSLDQLHCKMPERHKKFIRDAVCLFCHSSHLTGLLKKTTKKTRTAKLPLQTACQFSPSVVSEWTDMWTLGVLQKQESEGEEAPFGWLGWQGERRPSGREEVRPGYAGSRGRTLQRCYSGGGRRLCSFLSSRPFQYLKLLSKCCIRLGRSAKASHASNMSVMK